MFVNLMRSNQRWLMIIISALVIISFVFFYSNRTSLDRSVSDQVGKIYGRALTTEEVARIERQLQTAEDLRLYDLLGMVSGDGSEQNDAFVNHLVLQHESQALGIEPSNDEVKDAEMKLPAFEGPNGAFDPGKYATFVDDKLTPRGFSDTQLDELVRRNLQFTKLRQIVEAGVVVSPAEVRLGYEQRFSKTDASVVRLKTADFAVAVAEPKDDEIKKYYDEQKDRFQQPERRKVQYVKFALDEAQKKLTGKARMDALKPDADHALELLEQLEDQKGKADFAAIAAASKLPVTETAEFEEGESAGLAEAAIPGFVEAAFKLTAKDPNSDVPLQAPSAEMPDAYYDLHLSGVTPQRPLTLEEAKPKIVVAIKEERARTALAAKAEEIRTKIIDGLKGGRSFADAAKDAGHAGEDLQAFSQMEPMRTQSDASQIADAAVELSSGELSKFVPTPEGGVLVYVRGREPVDQKRFDMQKDRITSAIRQQKARVYFAEWLRASREAAAVQIDMRTRSRG